MDVIVKACTNISSWSSSVVFQRWLCISWKKLYWLLNLIRQTASAIKEMLLQYPLSSSSLSLFIWAREADEIPLSWQLNEGTSKLEEKCLEESLACAHISDSPAFNAVNILAAAVPGSSWKFVLSVSFWNINAFSCSLIFSKIKGFPPPPKKKWEQIREEFTKRSGYHSH